MDNLDKNKDIIERYTKLDKSIESDKSLISIGITKFKISLMEVYMVELLMLD